MRKLKWLKKLVIFFRKYKNRIFADINSIWHFFISEISILCITFGLILLFCVYLESADILLDINYINVNFEKLMFFFSFISVINILIVYAFYNANSYVEDIIKKSIPIIKTFLICFSFNTYCVIYELQYLNNIFEMIIYTFFAYLIIFIVFRLLKLLCKKTLYKYIKKRWGE